MLRWEGAKELCETQAVVAELVGSCPNKAGDHGPPPAPTTALADCRNGKVAGQHRAPRNFPSFTWPDMPCKKPGLKPQAQQVLGDPTLPKHQL